jgi:PleD family two-component response regulator
MRAADKALYVAKHEGRDRWHVAGEEATAGVGH